MPYIDPAQRKVLDPIIGQFGGVVGGDWCGDLNYIITKLCLLFYLERPSYSRAKDVDGVLGTASKEWYRRVTTPYEDEKKAINGDVYGPDPELNF